MSDTTIQVPDALRRGPPQGALPPNTALRLASLVELRSLRLFLGSVLLAVALCISGGFVGMAFLQRRLIQEEMVNRARRDFLNIASIHRWNAQYGGVYVEKKPGDRSNPYLEDPDIVSVTGRVYTKKNPVLVTHDLSKLVVLDKGYAFHLTSLRPLNPENRPDGRETEALRAFERGEKEMFWFAPSNGQNQFCYMGPLYMEESCMVCHGRQGYRLGDVRGGISVSVDISDMEENLTRNLVVGLASAVGTTLLLMLLVALLFRQFARRLRIAREELHTLATTDSLTGLMNRRAILEHFTKEQARTLRTNEPISCILFDIDHFKNVNDGYGHQVGDDVLREVASVALLALRPYDSVGRIGGEEFLAVLPSTGLGPAREVAERLRAAFEAHRHLDVDHPVTSSFGVGEWKPGEPSGALLSRIDRALYRAKRTGRNRVEITEH